MPLVVEKISEGTVIDHIPVGAGSRVLQILSMSHPVKGMSALIMNAHSKKLGRKDIVKMEGVFIDEAAANRISLIAPEATMNIIRKSKVVDKHRVEMPSSLAGLFACPNPRCITNLERAKTTFFRSGGPLLRCRHCERLFKPEELA